MAARSMAARLVLARQFRRDLNLATIFRACLGDDRICMR